MKTFPFIRPLRSKWLTVLLLANIAAGLPVFSGGGCDDQDVTIRSLPGNTTVQPNLPSGIVEASIGRNAFWSIDPTEGGWFKAEIVGYCLGSVCEMAQRDLGADRIQIQLTGGEIQSFLTEDVSRNRGVLGRSIKITAFVLEDGKPTGKSVTGNVSVQGLAPAIVAARERRFPVGWINSGGLGLRGYEILNTAGLPFELEASEDSDFLTIKKQSQVGGILTVEFDVPTITLECRSRFCLEEVSINVVGKAGQIQAQPPILPDSLKAGFFQ